MQEVESNPDFRNSTFIIRKEAAKFKDYIDFLERVEPIGIGEGGVFGNAVE